MNVHYSVDTGFASDFILKRFRFHSLEKRRYVFDVLYGHKTLTNQVDCKSTL